MSLRYLGAADPSVFLPRLHWLETSNLLNQKFEGRSWQWSPYLKNVCQRMIGFSMEGHKHLISWNSRG